MEDKFCIADGLYRLVKIAEDENPVFPSHETVVEVKGDEITNLSTSRCCELSALGATRILYGPIQSPYDITPVDRLSAIKLPPVADEVTPQADGGKLQSSDL